MFIRIQQKVLVLNVSWFENDRDCDHLHNCIHMLSTGQVHSVLSKQQIQDRGRHCHWPKVLGRKYGAFLLSIEAVYLSNSLIKYLLGNIFSFILRVVQTQAIYFWNQCRKESNPTYNDSENKSLYRHKSIEDGVI